MAYAQEQLQEAYRKLPKDIQDAIFSVDVAEIIRTTGEKHKLMIDKIGELADETGLVMLGFTHPSQFISHLAERLEVDKAVAKEIAEEINTKVFFPIRENLKKIHGIEGVAEGVTGEKPVSSTAQPTAQPSAETKPLQKTGIGEIPPAPTSPAAEKIIPPPTPEMPAPTAGIPAPTPVREEVPPPPAPPITESHPIFEAKTKEETFRSPMEISEKGEPSKPEAEIKKVDPYREQVP
jgi:hypothetical protein